MFRKIFPGYGRYFLWYELAFSLIGVAAVWFFIDRTVGQTTLQSFLGDNRQILYSSVAVIAGALLGFVIAGVTVLLVLPQNRLLAAIKETKAYNRVHLVFFSTLKVLAITTLIALTTLFIDTTEHPHLVMFYATLWGLVISSLRIGRCVWVLENIIVITERGRELEQDEDEHDV